MIKIAEEANITIIEIEGTILIQSNIKDYVYQIQRMLANKLDVYREKENKYVDNNI